MMWRALLFLLPLVIMAQNESGELRLTVVDQLGAPVAAAIQFISQSNQFKANLHSDSDGKLVVKRVPFGIYHVAITNEGFLPYTAKVEVRSALPADLRITLGVAALETSIDVNEAETVLDPHRIGSSNRIGSAALAERSGGQPGRSIEELVNAQPGWLLEANGVLHPRGSEYQTQYVVDGVPMTDNRSPAFAPEIEADDVKSMNVLTGDYPAEYGRKLGGVIEVNTARDARPGLHGKALLSGGTFATLNSYATAQYSRGANTISFNAAGARTDRYLDPPVEANFTNKGSTSSEGGRFERDLGTNDRINFTLRHAESKFLVPDEKVQYLAGQRQDRDASETAGLFSYQHVFSPNLLGDLHGLARDVSSRLWSNSLSTPIAAGQDRGFRQLYLKGTVAAHHGVHELKFGAEADFSAIREAFGYQITDPEQFDPGTPPVFRFQDRSQDREQSAFAQDLIRLGRLTLSAGLRYDHYHVVVEESAFSPRLGVAWFWPRANMVFRASYDRVFQTPAFENLLLASSPQLAALNDTVVRLPVRPSRGNFYEAGLSKGVWQKARLEASYFRRAVDRFADDDVLLNTGVSFPISFRKAEIHGVEAKLELVQWGRVSGFVGYTNMLGTGFLPVTGGLFLGSDAAAALALTDRFPVTQDQRNTARGRLRYQLAHRAWTAFGASYGSGLPVEFSGTREDAVAQAGERIVSRVNLDRGRVRPSFSADASLGADLRRTDRSTVRFQLDASNITNRLNVINFAGLFSGTGLAAPRAVSARLTLDF